MRFEDLINQPKKEQPRPKLTYAQTLEEQLKTSLEKHKQRQFTPLEIAKMEGGHSL
jgi:hypothetical protein